MQTVLEEQNALKNCNALLLTGKIADRESWLRMGAEITEPGFVVLYNTVLTSEMYHKALLSVHGTYRHTSAPVSIVLGTNKWRIWQMGKRNNIYIGYDPESRVRNQWWDALSKTLGETISSRIPEMFGPLAVFAMDDSITYNELEMRREIINFLVSRYRHDSDYIFLRN